MWDAIWAPLKSLPLWAFVTDPDECSEYIRHYISICFSEAFFPPTICFLNVHDSPKWALLHGLPSVLSKHFLLVLDPGRKDLLQSAKTLKNTSLTCFVQ